MGDAALSMESGYRIRCLKFAGALFGVADLIVGHEKLEVPDRSSSD